MAIRTISYVLLPPTDKLKIKLSVSLLDGFNKDSFYSLFETQGYDYLTLNILSNVVFQYKSEVWDRNQQLHINDSNIFMFNRKLNEFYTRLTRQGLFSYFKNGNITCHPVKEDIVTIALKGGEYLELEPGVIFDTNKEPLPGVYMSINVSENRVDLSIDEFEAILYKFAKIDIGTLGLQVLQTKLLLEDKLKELKHSPSGYDRVAPKPNIFQALEEEKIENVEEIIDRRVPKIEPVKDIFDL